MILAPQTLTLGFSSIPAFWSQVGVFVSEYPHQRSFAHNVYHGLPLSVEILEAVQSQIFEMTLRSVDLSECLAWQRQFSILGKPPDILSSRSLLGQLRDSPQQQDALRNLASFYLDKNTPLEDVHVSSAFIRRRLEQIRKEKALEEASLHTAAAALLGQTGPNLVSLALKAHHEEALLRCDYSAALLSAFWLYGYLQGSSGGSMPAELQREVLIRIAFANTADALSKDHMDRATDLVGFSLATIRDMERSRLLETNAWFADRMKPRIQGLGYSELKERLILPRQEASPTDLKYFILGIGFALLLTDPSRYKEFWPRLTADFPPP